PGNDPALLEQLRERRAADRALPDRLVEEDDAADELLDALGGEEEVTVGAAALLRRLDVDRVEALLDRPVALVRGEDPLVLGDQRAGGRLEVWCSHLHPSRNASLVPRIISRRPLRPRPRRRRGGGGSAVAPRRRPERSS